MAIAGRALLDLPVWQARYELVEMGAVRVPPAHDHGIRGDLALQRNPEPLRLRPSGLGIPRRPGPQDRGQHGDVRRGPVAGRPVAGAVRIEARPPGGQQHHLGVAAVERPVSKGLSDRGQRVRLEPREERPELGDPHERVVDREDLAHGRSGVGGRESRTRPGLATAQHYGERAPE